MNIFQEIKLFLAARKMISTLATEATTMNGTKPGWKTSEFWITLLMNVIGALTLIKGIVPAPYSAYVIVALTVLNSVYTIARSFVKTAAVPVTPVAPIVQIVPVVVPAKP